MPTQSDIIYATYPSQMLALTNKTRANRCLMGQVSCFTTSQCVYEAQWCNNRVDCQDASDETACSCESRLAPERICDGYEDCPYGSDEMGCFGCDPFAFSCFKTHEEAANRPLQCYTVPDKCDGFTVCRNGADEERCSMLVQNLGQSLAFQDSYMAGFLFRSYKGVWYPVCGSPQAWASDACKAESGGGHLSHLPVIEIRRGTLEGPFITPRSGFGGFGDSQFKDHCNNQIVHVRCPDPKCGRITDAAIQPGANPFVAQSTCEDPEVVTEPRVVGGKESDKRSWPFVVGIYRDGMFQCGGSIYHNNWVRDRDCCSTGIIRLVTDSQL